MMDSTRDPTKKELSKKVPSIAARVRALAISFTADSDRTSEEFLNKATTSPQGKKELMKILRQLDEFYEWTPCTFVSYSEEVYKFVSERPNSRTAKVSTWLELSTVV